MGIMTSWWKQLSPSQLNICIQAFSLIAIFFEGYDQGIMGGVNASPNYVTIIGIGLPNGTVMNTTHQGGIVSIHYFGAIFGAFIGDWAADRIGRINGVFFTAMFTMLGGALQAATQSLNFILVACVITGLSLGRLFGICFHCQLSGYFLCNFGLSFIDGGKSADLEEVKEVLEHVRGGKAVEVETESMEICAVAENTKLSSPIQFAKVLLGCASDILPHLGRQGWLCIWLQIMALWMGITAVTTCSPILLSQAGYSSIKRNGLAGA